MKTLGNASRFYAPRTLGNGSQLNVAYKDLANIFAAAQTISLATSGVEFTLENTANDANAGITDYYRRRGSAAGQDGDDLWENQYNGLDDAGSPSKTKYARTLAEIVDASNTTEDGRYSIGTMRAGTVVDWRFESGAVYYQTLTVPTAAGAINATEYQLNNVSIGNQDLQKVFFQSQTADSTTDNIPSDTSKPRWDEGKSFWSQAFTPKSASSRIVVEISFSGGAATTGNELIVALFKDATLATDLAVAVAAQEVASNGSLQMTFKWSELSGTTAPRTYAARYGASSGTARLNSNNAGDTMGGIFTTTVEIREFIS